MLEKPFRILLDLTDLHIGAFKYVWINVSPRELKTIADLKSDLFKKLNFERHDIKLFVRDGLLLDDETIIVLREDDTVKVQYEDQSDYFQASSNCSFEGKSQKAFQKRNFIECCEENSSPKAKKHKRSHTSILTGDEELQFENTITKKKKKSKTSFGSPSNLSENVVTVVNNNDENLLDVGSATSVKRKKSNVVKLNETCASGTSEGMIEVNKVERFETANESVQSEKTPENGSQKKKRKRHRKRKNASNLIGSYVPNNDVTDNHCANPSELHTAVPDTSFVRKHILFTSPTPCQNKVENSFNEVTLKTKQESNETTPLSVCSKSPSLKEDSSQNSSENSNSYPKISTPSASNGYTRQNWAVSVLENEFLNSPSQNIVRKTKEKKDVEAVKISSRDLLHVEKTETFTAKTPFCQDKYMNLSPINVMPTIGAHVAFKMLELDQSYSPTVSEYKEGIVKNIDQSTQDVEIELLQKEIKPGRVGKFENLREDEEPSPEIIQTVTVPLSGLIGLKLVN